MFDEFFSTTLGGIVSKTIIILAIICVCAILIKVSKRIARKAVLKSRQAGNMRTGTIITLIQSTLKYVIYFIGFSMIMGLFGINIAPIIASAGIVGVAVAFGAQSLVKDVITGLFIMLEDSYAVGDYIKTAGVSGTVTEVGLRTTKIRDWTNETHIIPNGNIAVISNYSKEPLTCFINIPVSYDEEDENTRKVMQDAVDRLNLELGNYTSDIRILGIDKFEDNRLLYKIAFTASINDQLLVERAIRLGCKRAFDHAGIEMPAQYNTLISEGSGANA